LGIALVPGIRDHVQAAAVQFEDRGAYVATVLEGAAFPRRAVEEVEGPGALDWLYGLLSIGGALALAAAALAPGRVRDAMGAGTARLADRALNSLRALHSGHVGDYVTWLVVGTIVLGGLFAAAL